MQLAALASEAWELEGPAAQEEMVVMVEIPAVECLLLSAPRVTELPFRPMSMLMWAAKEAPLAMAALVEVAAAARAPAAMLPL
jgi:hypothetical protein